MTNNLLERGLALNATGVAKLSKLFANLNISVAEYHAGSTVDFERALDKKRIRNEIEKLLEEFTKVLTKLGIFISKLEEHKYCHQDNKLKFFTPHSQIEKCMLDAITTNGVTESLFFIHDLLNESREKALEMVKKLDSDTITLSELISDNFSLQLMWLSTQTHFTALYKILCLKNYQ